jgi:endoribonuclease Dicer
LIENFQKDEDQMNKEITHRMSNGTFIGPEERINKVVSSGASVSSGFSISLLHQYCSKLPHDEYALVLIITVVSLKKPCSQSLKRLKFVLISFYRFFLPCPEFFYFDDLGGTVCHIKLPLNAPIHQIVGTPQCSTEAAKQDACLKAIETLHKMGALNDYLLPGKDDANVDGLELDSSDSDSCKG